MLSDDENPILFGSQNQNENIMSQLLNEGEQVLKSMNQGTNSQLNTGDLGKHYLQEEPDSIRSIQLDESDVFVSIIPQNEEMFTSRLPKHFPEKEEEDFFLLGSSAEKKTMNQALLGAKNLIALNCKAGFELESRETKIKRYKQKKLRRVWDRKVQYQCRKVVADNRIRVKGRFIKIESQSSYPENTKRSPIKQNPSQLSLALDFNLKIEQESQNLL